MRQVTGNNSLPANVNKVSVRVVSGGHSFCVDGLPKKAFSDDVTVEFEVVTLKTILVPTEVFEAENAEKYLAVAGVPCSADEEAVCITDGWRTAVMAVSTECLAAIDETFGARAVFISPLLHRHDVSGYKLHIRTIGEVSCFKLYADSTLRFAEILPTAGADDVLYYVQGLDAQYGLKAYHIYIYGDGAEETSKVLKRYFKGVRCE